MKKIILSAILFPLILIAGPAEDAITSIRLPALNFKDAPISLVVSTLNALSRDADPARKGIKLLVLEPEGIDQRFTLSVSNVSYRTALELILKGTNLEYKIEGSLIVIQKINPGDLTSRSNQSQSNRGLDFTSTEQKNSVFTIKVTDRTSGVTEIGAATGFLARIKGRSFIVTNQHVIDGAAGPNAIEIRGLAGAEVTIGRVWVGVSHDLAMMEVLTPMDGYYHFQFHSALQEIKRGDSVIVVGNPLGGSTILESKGTVVGIGPRRVELDISVFNGNSGGPVIHLASDFVVGIVTSGEIVRGSIFTEIAKKRSDSPIANDLRIYSTRFDSIESWEEVKWDKWIGQKIELIKQVNRLNAFWAFLNSGSADPFVSNKETIVKSPEIWRIYEKYVSDLATAGNQLEINSAVEFVSMSIEAALAPRGSFRSEFRKRSSDFYSWNYELRSGYPYNTSRLEVAYEEAYLEWSTRREIIAQSLRFRKKL